MTNNSIISPATLEWLHEDGNLVPVSKQFGDVYYSLADGLAESRYVFLAQNKLPQRFANLWQQPLALSTTCRPVFSVLELGFGTGLNMLATWQLWKAIKQQQSEQQSPNTDIERATTIPQPRLHLISIEKYPLSHKDLQLSLQIWQQRDPSLTPLIDQLLTLYPTLIAGCHRLHLSKEVTLDLWLGDAATTLAQLLPLSTQDTPTKKIDAWFLDGFAPSCNDSLWSDDIFASMQRLSGLNATFATYSCAGVVKRGLAAAGFAIKKAKGFGKKNEMLIGTFQPIAQTHQTTAHSGAAKNVASNTPCFSLNSPDESLRHPVTHVGIIGAGVSGLMAAWSLAQRGLQVTLIDKTAPLAGASGNPRALLAPKMTPLTHVAEHLHSISYLYGQRLYRQLDATHCNSAPNDALRNPPNNQSNLTDNINDLSNSIFTATGVLDLLQKTNVDADKIAQYPADMAVVLTKSQTQQCAGLQQQNIETTLYLPQAGLVNPRSLADKILSHPNINLQIAEIVGMIRIPTQQHRHRVCLDIKAPEGHSRRETNLHYDAVVIATAYHSHKLDNRIFDFRKIRGQLSWFEPTPTQLAALPKRPLKYNGYCALFTPQPKDDRLNRLTAHKATFLLGASFVRNELDLNVRPDEHDISRQKLFTAIPELQSVLTDTEGLHDQWAGWQARVGIRAQTPDYHPLVGQVDEDGLIWTLSGMGSKGFAFAPLCAEVLADMMLDDVAPLPARLLARLDPKRQSLQTPLK